MYKDAWEEEQERAEAETDIPWDREEDLAWAEANYLWGRDQGAGEHQGEAGLDVLPSGTSPAGYERSEDGSTPSTKVETDFPWPQQDEITTYALGRVPERTYVSKSFPLARSGSKDVGQPARFVYKVFDPQAETAAVFDGTEWVLRTTPKGRYQFKLLIAREAGMVKQLWIERVPSPGSGGSVKVLLNMQRQEVERLFALIQDLHLIPIEGTRSVRVDDQLLKDLFASPEALGTVYKRDPERFRTMIAQDASAQDLLAMAQRRTQIERFRRLLEDADFFDREVQLTARHREEDVWQALFEANPWMLGVTLTGQLLTCWNKDRLEQMLAGASIRGVGKRADAVLRTSGRIRSMVFAEIKTHRADLLASAEYRSGCWAPSRKLTQGIAQAQGTVHLAVADIGERLQDRSIGGGDVPGEFTYLLRPRSFLIIGRLTELLGNEGGHHLERIRSFELYRRHLVEPEVITFDELLARAEWLLTTAESK
jgi:hypothetical protein